MGIIKSRRDFLKTSGMIAAGSVLFPACAQMTKTNKVGLQLYSVRKEMLADACLKGR